MSFLAGDIQRALRGSCALPDAGIPPRGRPAALALAISLLVPGSAFADSSIDGAIQPYFVLGGWATAAVFLGLAVFILGRAIPQRRMASAAAQWPTTAGTVVSTGVVKHVSKSDDEFDTFVPEVRYEYEADGIRREGNVIRVGLGEAGYLEEKKAFEHAACYPVGATIAVRYDPVKPEHAVLELGQIGVGRKIFAGWLLALIGLAGMVFAIWIASLPNT
jgi:Protein of unknown function (DUF3592)